MGRRSGVTPNGRRTTASPIDITVFTPAGVIVTDWDVTVTPAFAGTALVNYDCGPRYLKIETPLTGVTDCLYAAMDIRGAGYVDRVAWNTVDGLGPYARVQLRGLRKLLSGPWRVCEGNRYLNPPNDAIVSEGSDQPGGAIIRGNYIGPLYNLVEVPVAWDAGRTYSVVDVVLNMDNLPYRSLIDGNIGNPPPVGAVETDPFWELYTNATNGPHGDAIWITRSIGDGILIEDNMVDWVPGPLATGRNNVVRVDRSPNNTNLVGPITWRENFFEFGDAGSARPIAFAERGFPGFDGPFTFVDNFLGANGSGVYIDADGKPVVWSNNVDATTGLIIPSPA